MNMGSPSSRRQPAAEIPEDLLIEILLRVPAKYVLKFRLLSKFHRALIDSTYFIRRHPHHASIRKPCIIICRRFRGISSFADVLEFDSFHLWPKLQRLMYPSLVLSGDSTNLVGSCQGILCYEECHFHCLVFCNPMTRVSRYIMLSRALPIRKAMCLRYFMGHDAVTDDLKVLKITGEEWLYVCEIYSSRTNSWKSVRAMNGYEHRQEVISLFSWRREVVFVEGTNCLHITAVRKNSDSTLFGKIIGFDFSAEKFTSVPLPKHRTDWNISGLSCLSGCLCFYQKKHSPTSFDLWMMKEYGECDSWALIFSLSHSITCSDLVPLDLLNNGRELILRSPQYHDRLFCFEFEKKEVMSEIYLVKPLYPPTTYGVEGQFLYTPSFRLP